jgi:shikimate kinase / 3-dehydroquinate synthase
MHIFLYGPSGSGKSTVGKQLASSLAYPFIDLDAEVENHLGQTISDFISKKGEDAFRNIESELLNQTISGSDKVIALGGGALLLHKNLELAQICGQIVFLEADENTIISRLKNDPNKRPLLAGEIGSSLKRLLKERQAHYGSFSLRVDAAKSSELVSWDIRRKLGRYHLSKMGAGYDVVVQDGGLDAIGEFLKKREIKGPMLLVSDSNVGPIYADRVLTSLQKSGLKVKLHIIPAGETNKTIDTVSSIWQGCLDANLDRKSSIIALGGGVVSDLAGFSAATYMRGCKWVSVPTTFLAMVDASIGGKTGFDLPQGKNLVGAFYPPSFVLADPDVLSTLPERELRAGLAEVVKHGVIADKELFDLCTKGWEPVTENLSELVRRGMAVKVKVIEEDPFEQGVRAALNFGHTVGHAVEVVSNFDLLHGEAIAIGMIAEARLAERLSIADDGFADTIKEVLFGLNLPVHIPENLSQDQIILAMNKDKKKSNGRVQFALPVKIGEIKVGVEIKNLASMLEEMK